MVSVINGKRQRRPWRDRSFTLRRGLITELRSFFDTIDMIEQLTGRDLVGPCSAKPGRACVRRWWSCHLRSGNGYGAVMVSPETKCRNRRLEPSSRRPRQNTFRNVLSESLNPFAD